MDCPRESTAAPSKAAGNFERNLSVAFVVERIPANATREYVGFDDAQDED
jgi:hypothetical protein